MVSYRFTNRKIKKIKFKVNLCQWACVWVCTVHVQDENQIAFSVKVVKIVYFMILCSDFEWKIRPHFNGGSFNIGLRLAWVHCILPNMMSHTHTLSLHTHFKRLNCAPEYNLCDYYCQPFLWKVFDYILWRNKHKLAAMQTLNRPTNRPTALLTQNAHISHKTNKYGFTCTNLFMTNVFLYLLQRFLRSFRIPFVLSECGFQFLLKIFVVFSIFFLCVRFLSFFSYFAYSIYCTCVYLCIVNATNLIVLCV